ncbi:uncharacterized protein (TIGR04141 family) [Pseudoclavibacter sp. JAI123]|uniref:DUF6119 family protein n=1 Tax=Pseudoclavibacter sp. JAI123 TaxID=2723065 RepID=UPI0015CBDE5C|nr:DUF6119 family protein [Pseudoclavibacter sp. JAI123]NYF14053.1 uncharacterized protein (TIGR04141 family) [Pseudoclavibacter sp. JAI123]
MRTQRLTIFLLRDIDQFDDAIADDVWADLEISELTKSSGLTGRFYSKRNAASTPSWAQYVEPAVEGGVHGVQSASASGLLVISVDGLTFALTFGYGRSFIDQARIERRFGLKVALNLIDDKQIRSLDTKVFDEMVVSRNTQTSRTAELPAFGVDILRDIVRAVTGMAPASTGYKGVSGADALVLGVKAPVTDLPSLLRDLYGHYTATKYKAAFGWVDHLAEVRDPALANRLDAQLIEQLRVSDTTSTHMAMSENLDWEDIEYFSIVPTRRQTQFVELDLDAYLTQPTTRAGELTIEQLKRRKVAVKFNSSADAVDRWSIYQCVVTEQKIDGNLYALVEGRWFEIAGSLVAQVDSAVSAIPHMSVTLPAGYLGESEGDYNARAAAGSSDLVLLDKQLVAPDGAKTRLEFCDLISTNGSLIHVKRKSRSSTLSHLFAQGHVSAEAMVDDLLREQVRTAIASAVGLGDASRWLELVPPSGTAPYRDRITVTYAVLANSKARGIEWLPFFSRLTLMQTVRDLNRLGFTKIALARIPVENAALTA